MTSFCAACCGSGDGYIAWGNPIEVALRSCHSCGGDGWERAVNRGLPKRPAIEYALEAFKKKKEKKNASNAGARKSRKVSRKQSQR